MKKEQKNNEVVKTERIEVVSVNSVVQFTEEELSLNTPLTEEIKLSILVGSIIKTKKILKSSQSKKEILQPDEPFIVMDILGEKLSIVRRDKKIGKKWTSIHDWIQLDKDWKDYLVIVGGIHKQFIPK